MPRTPAEDNSLISPRICPPDKVTLLRAVALQHADLTEFVLQHALKAAKSVIAEVEQVELSERDSVRVLDLLENPPAPKERLLAAAKALPRRR